MTATIAGFRAAGVLASLACATATHAQTPPTQPFFDAVEISDHKARGLFGDIDAMVCVMDAMFHPELRREIELTFTRSINDDRFVSFQVGGWTRPQTAIDVGLIFIRKSDGKRTTVAMIAEPIGDVPTGTRNGLTGLVPQFKNAEFDAALGEPSTLQVQIRLPETGENSWISVADVDLQGSAIANGKMETCVTRMRQREEARAAAEGRLEGVPRDPFARPN